VKKGQAIHQWAAGASTGDAITSYSLALRSMFRRWGCESELFADYRHVSFDARRDCRDIRAFPGDLPGGSIVIYHFSIGSELTQRFLSLPPSVTRVVCYHNITPARYVRSLRPAMAKVLDEGRRQMALLAPAADFTIGDSTYNCEEMREAGCKRTARVPLMWKRPDITPPPDAEVLSAYSDGSVNWIFVGRVAPNKKLEDVIRSFYFFRKTVHPHSRLFLVGSFAGMERYVSSLRALTVQLDLPGVIFTGHVTSSQLVAYYRLAHLFVSMSEHEGFCLPLLEAMSFDIPVLAYGAAAVPETVGDGGVIFGSKNHPMVAETAGMMTAPGKTRDRLVAAGRERLRGFDESAVEKTLREALAPFLEV
jgi:glycosyltransferase involved in cell wall biosynthesis